MSLFSNATRGHFASRRSAAIGLTFALLFLALPLARIGAFAQGFGQPSVAGDNAEVIAQGVASLPYEKAAWRLVEDTAEPLGEATFEDRALGFAIAIEGGLLLTDNPSAARTVLSPGEAAFVVEGASQARESLEESATSYLRIGLVDESEADNGNGDDVLFAGNGFAAPEGDREIELVGVKLERDDSTTVESDFEALVIVLDGKVTVGEGEVLEAGETTVVDGTVELLADEGSARVMVAVIGAEAPEGAQVLVVEESTPVIEPEAGVGRIIVLSALCPAGVTSEQAQDLTEGDPCAGGEAVEEMTVDVVNTDTGEGVSVDIDPSNATAAFQGLPEGNYDVTFATGEELGETVGVCGGQDQSADLDVVSFAGSSVNLDLPAEREYLCVTRTLQLEGEVSIDEGMLSATFYACPEGMTFDTLDTTQCELITEGFDFGFQGDVENPDLNIANATPAEGTFVWGGLTVNPDATTGVSYAPIVFFFPPPGYDAYAISTDGGDILLPHAGGYGITEAQPTFSLEVFFFFSS